MYMMIMTIILVIANYRGVHNYCFFSKSKYFIFRLLGIVLYLILALFIELMVISLIIAFFEIN